ncbi:MAG TPA: alpha-isopropylmalate synthase regulatory domain-containing protein, partial [bacterium]|nr:alpha-isopropylmalate synthase regulatory domain-containing protein [bacterium]
SGSTIEPVATVRMRKGDQEHSEASCGDGPVDAVYKAIRKITNTQSQLTTYQLKAVTGGTDAQGEVRVVLEEDGLKASGVGTDTDVIIASAKAYVNAINRLLYMKSRRAQNAK